MVYYCSQVQIVVESVQKQKLIPKILQSLADNDVQYLHNPMEKNIVHVQL